MTARMAAIIATARRLHPPASHRPPSVDGNQPLRIAPQPVPLVLLLSVRAIPAMVATSTGMAMESVASDAPSSAAEIGICVCRGRGCSARGNRPLERCQVDRREGDVILAALTSGTPIGPIGAIGPRASCLACPVAGAAQP